MQLTDAINLFYVGLTRAECALHVIAKKPAKDCIKAVQDGKSYDWKYMSELLYAFVQGADNRFYGAPYDFSQLTRKEAAKVETLPSDYVSIPIGARLTASEEACDFFGEDELTGVNASARLRGTALHQALSRVRSVDDMEGKLLDLPEAERLLLSERIAAHPQWFAAHLNVSNEASIVDTDGSIHRPDRVVIAADGSVSIIDYKFGTEKASYIRQVSRYMDLYRRMGYADVSAYLWYVPEDRVVRV